MKHNRPAGYFDGLLGGTENETLGLMRKYSLHPPDDAEGNLGNVVSTFDDAARTPEGKKVAIKYRKMADKVAYISLTKAHKGQHDTYSLLGSEGAGVLYGKVSYTQTGSAVPVFWLPWQDGGIISLKIPQKGTVIGDDPDRFFTAAINGCSVFFTGPATHPRVYHAGGSTYQSTAQAGARFWRGLVGDLTNKRFRAEVNKTHYITQDGILDTKQEINKKTESFPTTQAAKDYRRWLETTKSDRLHIKEVNPWGCVMGIRKPNGKWSFYLQQNATVKYIVLKKKKKFGLFGSPVPEKEHKVSLSLDGSYKPTQHIDAKKGQWVDVIVDQMRVICHPIKFARVYPNAEVGAVIPPAPLPTVSHG